MIAFTRINHVGIRVKSLPVSRVFYEKLGFVFLAGPLGPEPVAIMEHPSGVNINLILNAASKLNTNVLMDIPEKHPGYTHIALEVDDIDQTQALLQEKGFLLTGGPIITPEGAVFIFIRDPDGNVIEFHQPVKA